MTYGTEPSPWAVGLLAVLYVGAQASEWVRGAVGEWRRRRRRRRQPTALEALQEEYATTPEMDEAEFERRLDQLMDPCDEETRDVVQEADDVGRVTAKEVAVHFESVEHVRQASRRELMDVPHVGPERADAIRNIFD